MDDSETIPNSVVLPTYYVEQIITQAENMSYASKKLIQAVSFGLDLTQETVSFPPKQFYYFVSTLKKLTGENLGLLVGRRLLVNTHGSLGTVAMNCGSIRQFVNVVSDFLPLRTDLVSIDTCVRNEKLCMQLHASQPLGKIEQIVTEAIMVAIKNVFDYITIGEERKIEVAFAFAKGKNALLAQRIFSCKLSYAKAWTGFAFPLSELDEPLIISDKSAFEQAVELCRQELAELDAHLPLHKKIEHIIKKQNNDFLSFEQVAIILNQPERTLHRQLAKENVRFNTILDKFKYQKALKYLESGLTIKESSFLLGYQHTSNFSRAFKRWKKQFSMT